MSTIFLSTDVIGSSAAHTFTGDNQQLYVGRDVNIVNTSGQAIADMDFADNSVTVLGTVISNRGIDIMGDNGRFEVARGGYLASSEANVGNWALSDFSGVNSGTGIVIHGTVSAAFSSGIVGYGDLDIVVTGEVSAGANAINLGTFASNPNNSLTNSGTILGGLHEIADETSFEQNFSHGVRVGAANSRIINLETGVIASLSSNNDTTDGPSGIEYQNDSSGARLRNYGEISSVNGYGVDANSVYNNSDMSLINFGTIIGELGSFRGDAGFLSDSFTNRGIMNGDVTMRDGADTFDNRDGTVIGDVDLGTGDDFYDGRLDAQVSGTILGGSGEDTVYGGHNADLIEGGDDNDELRGNGGNDEIRGDDGNDLMQGNDGDDELIGGNGNDSLFGGRGDDVLNGGNNNDRINGGDGNDRIIAGGGADILFGDAGADTFIFSSVNDSGTTGATRDRIFDFSEEEGDIIFLAGIDANENLGGNQVFTFVGAAGFTNTAGELRYISNGLLAGDTDGDGTADFQVFLTTAPTLTEDAFVL